VVLTTYGRAAGCCVDPIEKKPLYHVLPGTAVLSFGTAGCNLACRGCQNWELTTARSTDRIGQPASPEQLVATALRLGCRSVAVTYNDPVVFHEYAVDVASAGRARGLLAVAVTAGYVLPAPRAEFLAAMDAVNVACDTPVPGRFDGPVGRWGSRCPPVRIAS
jgi:pyruvate formate lyase activating enzyme